MIVLLNPRSASYGYRVPNSILTIGAFIEGKYDYNIFDENIFGGKIPSLDAYLNDRNVKYLGITVMPGLQLRRAVSISKEAKNKYPGLKIIWGGYFPSLHPNTVLKSGYVDFVLKGHSEFSFVELIDRLEGVPNSKQFETIRGLSYKYNGEIKHNPKSEVINPDLIPRLPYHKINVDRYLRVANTYLGGRTIAYHSSVGCPFLCGFCAVAGVYKGKWEGRNAELVADDLNYLKKEYNIGAVEFHDNNFFVSEKRSFEIAERIKHLKVGWWGEARPDTVMKYSDATLKSIADSGCRMIFFGAESGSEDILKLMHKGGTQNSQTVPELAKRLKDFGIVPEFSFVLGNPTDNVYENIKSEIKYIRKVKEINPDSEIIIYTYSPVNFEDSEMSLASKMKGFGYPKSLEEWVSPKWQNFDLRKNPLTPWMKPSFFSLIRHFEKTLNGMYPTRTDLKIRGWKKYFLKTLSFWRYKFSFYYFPYEVMITQKLFRYRQPETEGFPFEENANHNNFFKRKIRRVYSLIYFNLIHKRKLKKTVFEKTGKFRFTVYPTVFNPKDYNSSVIFAEFIAGLEGLKDRHLLDMGCGSGIISIYAASAGAFCTAVDKNPESVKCAKENAIQNGFGAKIKALESDLFLNIESDLKYDIISFNPPYYTGKPENNFQMAFKGGENLEVIRDFFKNAGSHLKNNGIIYLIISSDSNLNLIEEIIKENNFFLCIVTERKKFFETFYILRVSRNDKER